MADWDEVKRLAADFQKVQLSSTTQRLSERNCIEIVTWLMQKKLLDLIFTTDGKEYLTSAQLVSDIRGELYVNSGRVNLVELAKTIGVDLNHINSHINEVLKGHKDIHSVLGQLIDNSYIIRIADEINQKLVQQGQINVNDLTIQYDLPADFLQQHVLEKHLGKVIFGQQDKADPRIFFTESFIARSKAKIRGALTGLTRPTPVSLILSNINISEKLFFSLFDQATMFGILTSRMTGAQYIPNVYSRCQSQYVKSNFKRDGYLDLKTLTSIGITDYKTYLRRQLGDETLIFLDSCVVSNSLLERVESDIDACIQDKNTLDLKNNDQLSSFNDNDMKMILDKILTGSRQKDTVVIDNYILSKAFLDKLSKDCEDLVQEKAKLSVESGKYQQYQTDLLVSTKSQKHEVQVEVEDIKVDKREERRKKATGGKSGGGTQGRETKTKSTKKGGRSKVVDIDEDYEQPTKKTLEILSFDDVKNIAEPILEEECLDELVEPVTNYLLQGLNVKGLEIAASLYASTVTNRTASRRQAHNEIETKLNKMLGDIRLFEKGIKVFPSETQVPLYKYLVKSLCTDVVNEILSYILSVSGLTVQTDNFTHEQRVKYINDLPAEYKGSLQSLMKTLSGQNIEEFSIAAEDALKACNMVLKKVDRKKDRSYIMIQKKELLVQLNECEDPALVLHLAAIIIFETVTQCMLHASGRHVTSILTFLKQHLTSDQASELTSYHDLVTTMLSGGPEAETAKEKLMETMPTIKMIANEYKRPSAN